MELYSYISRIGTTRKELAEKLGISVSNLSMWQKGESFPDFKKIKFLLDNGMTIGELFGKDTEKVVLSSVKIDFDLKNLTPELCKKIVEIGLLGK